MRARRLRTKLLALLALATVITQTEALAQNQEASEETQPGGGQQDQQGYRESVLRRFEIVTLISLPFTAIHSFLAVRGVKMIQENEFSTELTGKDFRIVGVSAASLALFIGFWDWRRTHGKNPSEQLIPTTPQPRRGAPQRLPQRVQQDDWELKESEGFRLPLVQVRF